jgi:hypothetical protein
VHSPGGIFGHWELGFRLAYRTGKVAAKSLPTGCRASFRRRCFIHTKQLNTRSEAMPTEVDGDLPTVRPGSGPGLAVRTESDGEHSSWRPYTVSGEWATKLLQETEVPRGTCPPAPPYQVPHTRGSGLAEPAAPETRIYRLEPSYVLKFIEDLGCR